MFLHSLSFVFSSSFFLFEIFGFFIFLDFSFFLVFRQSSREHLHKSLMAPLDEGNLPFYDSTVKMQIHSGTEYFDSFTSGLHSLTALAAVASLGTPY